MDKRGLLRRSLGLLLTMVAMITCRIGGRRNFDGWRMCVGGWWEVIRKERRVYVHVDV